MIEVYNNTTGLGTSTYDLRSSTKRTIRNESRMLAQHRGQAQYKVARTDDYSFPGEIITADEATREACMQVGGETKTVSFGPNGLRLVGRRR